MKMKWIGMLIIGWGLSFATFAQNIPELKRELERANSTEEKMHLCYEIGNAYRGPDPEEGLEYAKRAHKLAKDLNHAGMTARTAWLVALVYERMRNDRNQEVWLRSTTSFAKEAGDADLIMRSTEKRGRLATKDRNYRRAVNIYRDAFEYFGEKGKSVSELEQQYDMQKRRLQREKESLEQERQQLKDEVSELTDEREILASRQSELVKRQRNLLKEKQEVEQQISEKDVVLDSLSKEKTRAEHLADEAERIAQVKEKQYQALSKEAMADSLALKEARLNLAYTERIAERHRYIGYMAGLAAAFFILVALLIYSRYRSSKRAKKVLEAKNRIIEDERERSEELLLNILPARIATELKEHGKARARRYEQVTVLFADFKNFTRISEQLSPEELVEELDRCFKAFDFIIGQYQDIEKIKTIGDAYMCASGLSNRHSVPHDIVKAALEMQQFLDEQREERMRSGKPYFEARIGMHTGPVVAGVVGVNKFAYDIWGDTVNTAARVESNCEEGRVNISETTYRLVKYHFDCEYRGKVDAKNKGPIEMYFVNKEVRAAVVS
jgi:adenylate cyclase